MIFARFPRIFSVALLSGLAVAGAACTSECEGVRCASLYPAADLNLLSGVSLTAPDVSPLLPDAAVHGVEAEGNDWAVAGLSSAVLAGIPDAGEVRRYDASSFFEAAGAVATVSGEGPNDHFGAALAVLSDGILVGAPGHTGGSYATNAGAVYEIAGDPETLAGDLEAGDARRVVEGEDAEGRLGDVVAACGDLDGDTLPDWATAAPWFDPDDAPLAGAVYVARSGAAIPTGLVDPSELTAIPGTDPGGRFGGAIACRDSLDGDAIADLVVGAPYAASSDGIGGAGAVEVRTAGRLDSAVLRLEGAEAEGWFGAALATGDMDGDGVPELAIGAPGSNAEGSASTDDDTAGAVYLYRGADVAAELTGATTGALVPLVTIRAIQARGRFGSTLILTDMDGDGAADLVVGAPGLNSLGAPRTVQAGAAYVFRGDPANWNSLVFANEADTTVGADRQYLRTGESLAITDLDGDAVPDLVLLNRAEAP